MINEEREVLFMMPGLIVDHEEKLKGLDPDQEIFLTGVNIQMKAKDYLPYYDSVDKNAYIVQTLKNMIDYAQNQLSGIEAMDKDHLNKYIKFLDKNIKDMREAICSIECTVKAQKETSYMEILNKFSSRL